MSSLFCAAINANNVNAIPVMQVQIARKGEIRKIT
jgi:hypothetical protein